MRTSALLKHEVGSFVGDLGRFRDACMLIARDRPYREYPASWVVAQLERAGFEVTNGKHFPIRYSERFLESQLAICENCIQRFENPALAEAMHTNIEQMRERGEQLIRQHDGLRFGGDYVLRAVRKNQP